LDIHNVTTRDAWEQHRGTMWNVREKGPILDPEEPERKIKVVAVCQGKNITDLLANPTDWKYMGRREGKGNKLVHYFGDVILDKLDIIQIDDVSHPDEVAELVGPMNADVLFIKYFMLPWTGEIILQALTNMARRKGYKRPKYIIGLDDTQSGLREMMSHGADGYIKINWLHGWHQWPRIDPEPYIVTNKTTDNFAVEPFKSMRQMAYGRVRLKLERMLAEGKLDPYRNDVSGFQNFVIDYPFGGLLEKSWMEIQQKVEPDRKAKNKEQKQKLDLSFLNNS